MYDIIIMFSLGLMHIIVCDVRAISTYYLKHNTPKGAMYSPESRYNLYPKGILMPHYNQSIIPFGKHAYHNFVIVQWILWNKL